MSTPGLKNMTVEVNGYSSSTCDVIGSTQNNNESLAGAVVKSVTVLVHPEGLVKTDTESAYFCANGKKLQAVPFSASPSYKQINVY